MAGHCECTWRFVQGRVLLVAYSTAAAQSWCLRARWLIWRSRLPSFLPFHEILGAAASKRAPPWQWCCWAAWRPPAHGIDVHTFRRKRRKPCLWSPVAWRLACQVLCRCVCRVAAAAAAGPRLALHMHSPSASQSKAAQKSLHMPEYLKLGRLSNQA